MEGLQFWDKIRYFYLFHLSENIKHRLLSGNICDENSGTWDGLGTAEARAGPGWLCGNGGRHLVSRSNGWNSAVK